MKNKISSFYDQIQCVSVVNNARNGAYGEDRILAVELKYGGKQKKDSF